MPSTHDAREAARMLDEVAVAAEFFFSQFDSLRKKYGNEYVAISKKTIVSHNADLGVVMADLERANLEPNEVLVEFCPDSTAGFAF